MTYILSEQRDNDDPGDVFELYRDYLRSNASTFPKSAYELATSDWYWDFRVSGCPHDAWMKSLTVSEPAAGSRQENRTVEIKIELLSPFHDGLIEFYYPRVYSYRLAAYDVKAGHCDWRYDEFRMDDDGNLVHEIEWWRSEQTANSLIIASDVFYKWTPLRDNVLHTSKAER